MCLVQVNTGARTIHNYIAAKLNSIIVQGVNGQTFVLQNVKLINISIDNAKRHEFFRIINHVAQQQNQTFLEAGILIKVTTIN